MAVLSARDVTLRFVGIVALDGVSFVCMDRACDPRRRNQDRQEARVAG